MIGHNGGHPWVNVLWAHAVAVGEPTPANLNEMAQFWGDAWAVNVTSKMSNNSQMTLCEFSYYGAGDDLLKGSATFSITGTNVGVVDPAQSAAVISWLVQVGYRGGHPRSYVAGTTVTQRQTTSTFTAAFLSSLKAGADTFRLNVNGHTNPSFSSLQLGTMSFVRNKAWRTPPIFIPYIGSHVDGRVDTQRRRLGPDVP